MTESHPVHPQAMDQGAEIRRPQRTRAFRLLFFFLVPVLVLVPVLAVALFVAAACSSDEGGDGGEDAVRMNQIQVLGSHNSYHLQPEPDLFAGIQLVSPELAESIEYTHLPLDQQSQSQ